MIFCFKFFLFRDSMRDFLPGSIGGKPPVTVLQFSSSGEQSPSSGVGSSEQISGRQFSVSVESPVQLSFNVNF